MAEGVRFEAKGARVVFCADVHNQAIYQGDNACSVLQRGDGIAQNNDSWSVVLALMAAPLFNGLTYIAPQCIWEA